MRILWLYEALYSFTQDDMAVVSLYSSNSTVILENVSFVLDFFRGMKATVTLNLSSNFFLQLV